MYSRFIEKISNFVIKYLQSNQVCRVKDLEEANAEDDKFRYVRT